MLEAVCDTKDENDRCMITVTVHDAPPPTNENASADNQHTQLILRYFYNPNTPAAPLHSHDNENEDVKTYYRKLWFQNENSNSETKGK